MYKSSAVPITQAPALPKIKTSSSSKTYILVIIFLLSFFALLYQCMQYFDEKIKNHKNNTSTLLKSTMAHANEIEEVLLKSVTSLNEFAENISDETITKKDMKSKLKALVANDSTFFGASITYKPYAFSDTKRLHSVYYHRKAGESEPVFKDITEVFDYTAEKHSWYFLPMRDGKKRWSEPYWDEAGQTYMVVYSTVFYSPEANDTPEVIGVMTLDVSLGQIDKIVKKRRSDNAGILTLVTQEGNYIYHPNSDNTKNWFKSLDVAEFQKDPHQITLAKKAKNGESGWFNHIDPSDDEDKWWFVAPVKLTGWSLRNNFIKNDIGNYENESRKKFIFILFLFVVCSISGASLLIWKINSKPGFYIAIFSSVILFGSTALLWNLASEHRNIYPNDERIISDKNKLLSVVEQQQQQRTTKLLPRLVEIPTGIHIDSMEFINSNKISISGRIWQNYSTEAQSLVDNRNIYFEKSSDFKLHEPIEQQTDDGVNILWRFQAQINILMDSSRYPLEVEHVGIEIKSVDKNSNIFLVPDLDSYYEISRTNKPGIGEDVFLSGWEIFDSFFTLSESQGTTNFGIDKKFDLNTVPTLYFQVGIKRVVLDSFFSNLMPLIVVLCILFYVMFLSADTNISSVLGICSSLFFAVVFSHLSIRKSIAIGEIFYLEYFFFVCYVAILLMPANAFKKTVEIENNLFEYKNGFFLKFAFWPSILGVFYLITAIKFY